MKFITRNPVDLATEGSELLILLIFKLNSLQLTVKVLAKNESVASGNTYPNDRIMDFTNYLSGSSKMRVIIPGQKYYKSQSHVPLCICTWIVTRKVWIKKLKESILSYNIRSFQLVARVAFVKSVGWFSLFWRKKAKQVKISLMYYIH